MIFFLLFLLCLFLVILYACVSVRTPHDRELDDRMQEEFLARKNSDQNSSR